MDMGIELDIKMFGGGGRKKMREEGVLKGKLIKWVCVVCL
jgi:hypothetical protein